MKFIIYKIYFYGLFYVLFLLGGCQQKNATSEDDRIDTIPALIMQVNKCSRLYSTEYKIHKIVTHDDIIRMKGNLLSQKYNIKLPLGDRKVAIPIDVTLKAYIDFTTLNASNIERMGDHITVTLPDPQIIVSSSRVDHKQTRQYISLTRSSYSDEELANFSKQGEESIINNLSQYRIPEIARQNAARTLIPLFSKFGFKEENMTIQFRKDFNTGDLKEMTHIESPKAQ